MEIDPGAISVGHLYGTLVNCIAPRPIGWLSTVDAGGRDNLAPFSFFNVASVNPPILMAAPLLTNTGREKDTLRNIEETRAFVHHPTRVADIDAVERTSEDLPSEKSEAAAAGLELIASQIVTPKRLKHAPIAIECRLHDIRKFGDGQLAGAAVFGEIVLIHVDDSVLDERGRLDASRLDLVGRFGSKGYSIIKNAQTS